MLKELVSIHVTEDPDEYRNVTFDYRRDEFTGSDMAVMLTRLARLFSRSELSHVAEEGIGTLFLLGGAMEELKNLYPENSTIQKASEFLTELMAPFIDSVLDHCEAPVH